jgi:hypothetical protein
MVEMADLVVEVVVLVKMAVELVQLLELIMLQMEAHLDKERVGLVVLILVEAEAEVILQVRVLPQLVEQAVQV